MEIDRFVLKCKMRDYRKGNYRLHSFISDVISMGKEDSRCVAAIHRLN